MKTVIEMAREADACHDDVQITPFLKRFAELVRADERAACAKVCDDAFDKFFSEHEMEFQRERYDKASVVRTVRAAVEFVTEDCAAAIRARTSS